MESNKFLEIEGYQGPQRNHPNSNFIFGILSVNAPIYFIILIPLIYIRFYSMNDAWGFGFFAFGFLGILIGSTMGLIFAVISLVREEIKWIPIVGLILNIPLISFVMFIIAN